MLPSATRILCLLTLLGATTAPVPSHALSCLPADPIADFLQANASDEIWIVVDGTLRFDERKLPPRDALDNNAPPQTDIDARLTGTSLGTDGFARPFDRAITLQALCYGPWCAGATDGARYLAFLKREGDGYVMPVNPCGSMVYQNATAEMRDALTTCFRGGTCTPAEMN